MWVILATTSAVASRKGTALRRHKSLRSCNVDRRRSAGSSVVTSRTALILQKSREALERKKQSELEEEELARAAGSDVPGGGGVSRRLSADQITTTGWQGMAEAEKLLALSLLCDLVLSIMLELFFIVPALYFGDFFLIQHQNFFTHCLSFVLQFIRASARLYVTWASFLVNVNIVIREDTH